MKRLILVALLVLASCAHVPPAGAGPLNIRFTMPATENAGTCAAPVIVPMAADPTLRGVFWWVGPVSGRDSVYAAPGAAIAATKYVPSGTYTLYAHAAKGSNVFLCDTSVVVVVTNPPGIVTFN